MQRHSLYRHQYQTRHCVLEVIPISLNPRAHIVEGNTVGRAFGVCAKTGTTVERKKGEIANDPDVYGWNKGKVPARGPDGNGLVEQSLYDGEVFVAHRRNKSRGWENEAERAKGSVALRDFDTDKKPETFIGVMRGMAWNVDTGSHVPKEYLTPEQLRAASAWTGRAWFIQSDGTCKYEFTDNRLELEASGAKTTGWRASILDGSMKRFPKGAVKDTEFFPVGSAEVKRFALNQQCLNALPGFSSASILKYLAAEGCTLSYSSLVYMATEKLVQIIGRDLNGNPQAVFRLDTSGRVSIDRSPRLLSCISPMPVYNAHKRKNSSFMNIILHLEQSLNISFVDSLMSYLMEVLKVAIRNEKVGNTHRTADTPGRSNDPINKLKREFFTGRLLPYCKPFEVDYFDEVLSLTNKIYVKKGVGIKALARVEQTREELCAQSC